MSAALRVRKYWRIVTTGLRVVAVTGDLSSAVTRGTHVTRSLSLPKSLSSRSVLPVKTPSALWSRGKAEGRRPFTTWTNPAKQMKSKHRVCATQRRSSIRLSTRLMSSVQRSRLRKSNPPRRSSFPRSSFRSSFPRCWCRRSTTLRSAFQIRTCSRPTLPWSSLLVE